MTHVKQNRYLNVITDDNISYSIQQKNPDGKIKAEKKSNEVEQEEEEEEEEEDEEEEEEDNHSRRARGMRIF